MIAADLVVLAHAAFIVFVALGGLLVIRWPRVAWLHLPAAAWGAVVELTGRVCPLTPLENRLRAAAGSTVYEGGFIEHYVIPVVYPPGLTRTHQIALGASVVIINLGLYALALRRNRQRHRPGGGS